MTEHRIRIFFSPTTPEVAAVLGALEGKSIPHSASEYRVERFDASGQSHMATIVTLSVPTAAANIEPLCEVLNAYVAAGRTIKITMPSASFAVANEGQLLEAAETIRQLQGTASDKPAVE